MRIVMHDKRTRSFIV